MASSFILILPTPTRQHSPACAEVTMSHAAQGDLMISLASEDGTEFEVPDYQLKAHR
jgi:hypothetical protein